MKTIDISQEQWEDSGFDENNAIFFFDDEDDETIDFEDTMIRTFDTFNNVTETIEFQSGLIPYVVKDNCGDTLYCEKYEN